jgi:SpoIID/LytB domain protein
MLIPGVIPKKEPVIQIGIILPEDNRSQVIINFPEKAAFRILANGIEKSVFKSQEHRFVKTAGNKILFGTEKAEVWRLEPLGKPDLRESYGTLVRDVIAGRGFHWQKQIDILLPGVLEISVFSGKLILINELKLEQYVICVATSEMAAACPTAFIEAQTIAARSWLLANIEQKHAAMGMDVCNDDCCQRYQGTNNLTAEAISGALKSRGRVLVYKDTICDARYSKCCGGVMESFQTIWNGKEIAYLQNIADAPAGFLHAALPLTNETNLFQWINNQPPVYCSQQFIKGSTLKNYLGNVDQEGQYFRWSVTYSQDQIRQLLNEKLTLRAKTILNFKPLKRGGSGRLALLEILYINEQNKKDSYIIDSEYNIRKSLHKNFLYSSCIYTQTEPADEIPQSFTIKGAGWGHGVGLCQIGALGMSLHDYSAEDILNHYYPGSELRQIYT